MITRSRNKKKICQMQTETIRKNMLRGLAAPLDYKFLVIIDYLSYMTLTIFLPVKNILNRSQRNTLRVFHEHLLLQVSY